MTAAIEFARMYPLLAIAIWFTVAGFVFSLFEQAHNLRGGHL